MIRMNNMLCKALVYGAKSFELHCFRIRTSFPLVKQLTLHAPLRRNYSSSSGTTSRKLFSPAFIVGIASISSAVTYLYYNNNNTAFRYPKMVRVPSVNAAQTVSEPERKYRNQFNFIADIVETNAPALVCIEIDGASRLDFFQRPNQTLVKGSGFIIEEDGLILTNAHVVISHPRENILVRLSSGVTYTAKLENIDVRTDLATLRINPKVWCKNYGMQIEPFSFIIRSFKAIDHIGVVKKREKKLPVMKLGTSRKLRPGEWVVAMGSPLSLSNTITAGIVSSVSRTSSELGLSGKDMEYIQTDAAITYGNSGGPLVNLDGEVVGINTMKVSSGISFAIPVDYVHDFLSKSKKLQSEGAKGGSTTRRYLGITMLSLTNDIIGELQSRNIYVPPNIDGGVLIWKIVVGSPAYSSGLLPGDIIVEMNGKPLKSVNDVYQALEQFTVINLRVYRGNLFLETTVFPEEIK